MCIVGAGLTLAVWLDNACTLATARKWWKSLFLIGIPCILISIFTPSKRTAYQILGITVATEVIKNYDKLEEISKSYIWRSHWDALTEVITFISNIPVYKPSPIGEVFLKGIDYGDTTI